MSSTPPWRPQEGGDTSDDDGWGRPTGRSVPPWEGSPQQDAGYPAPDRSDFGRHDAGRQDFFDPQPQWPGAGRPPQDSRYRPADDGWGGPGRSPAPWKGAAPPAAPRTAHHAEQRQGRSGRGIIAIGALVAIVIAVGAILLAQKLGGSSPTADASLPSVTVSSSAVRAPKQTTASEPAGNTGTGTGAGATFAFVSAPPETVGSWFRVADGYTGRIFLSTAQQVISAVASGAGGTVQSGSAPGGNYQLPVQIMTLATYQGTFTPAKLQTILGSVGSDVNMYPAGPDGGALGCVSIPASTPTAGGPVCVWATASTLGITEFFSTPPPGTQPANPSQEEDAANTLTMRAAVEVKKS